MMRAIVAVIVGYVAWSGLWLLGNAALFADAAEVVGRGEAYTEVGPLLGVIVLSLACSLVAGLITAKLAAGRARGAVLVMALLLLVTGIAVQAGVWSLMPTWYHLGFLALLVPVALFGGNLGAPRGRAASA